LIKEKTAEKKLSDRITRRLESKFQKVAAEIAAKNNIMEAFRRNGLLDADRIIVSVHDGTVELWGSVHTWAGIREAERISRTAPGVTNVDAHLRIGR
jgi:osmotically-inducible protein OsmY